MTTPRPQETNRRYIEVRLALLDALEHPSPRHREKLAIALGLDPSPHERVSRIADALLNKESTDA